MSDISSPLEGDGMKCPICDEETSDAGRFCIACGGFIQVTPSETTESDQGFVEESNALLAIVEILEGADRSGSSVQKIVEHAGHNDIPEERTRVILRRLVEGGAIYRNAGGGYVAAERSFSKGRIAQAKTVPHEPVPQDSTLQAKLDSLLMAVGRVRSEMSRQQVGDRRRLTLVSYSPWALVGLTLLAWAIVNENWESRELYGVGAGNLVLGVGGVILISWLPICWRALKRRKESEEL